MGKPGEFYHLVPKGVRENLAFRRRMLMRGYSDRKAARELWIMCKRDVLFYVNTFGWTISPKDSGDAPVIPLVTYEEFQDDLILEVQQCIGKEGLALPKSRDMGATWCVLYALEHRWHFCRNQLFLLSSEVQELVDQYGDERPLFQKLDFMHRYQPYWLLPKGRHLVERDSNRKQNSLKNPETRSIFTGQATVPDLGRSGRYQAIMKDENAFQHNAEKMTASASQATDCIIRVSTPNGRQGDGAEFHRVVHDGSTRVFSRAHPLWQEKTGRKGLHWSVHPEKARGLYTVEQGRLRILDTDYLFPKDYPFVTDGKYPLRSPWFDRKAAELGLDVLIAQELELDFGKSDSPFFDPDSVMRLKSEFGRTPELRGRLDYDPVTFQPKFEPDPNGNLSLWCELDEHGRFAAVKDDYIIGIDISEGTGASNSVLSVGNRSSGTKVAEWADNRVSIMELAPLAIALAKMFHRAKIIWEANGPGNTFRLLMMDDLHYSNVYFHRDHKGLERKPTDKPGWYSSKQTKKMLLESYRASLYGKKFINPSIPALNECLDYVYAPNGAIVHGGSAKTDDYSDSGENHGDRVIADALLCKLLREQGKTSRAKKTQTVPVMSLAWRRAERKRDAEANSVW